MTISLFASLSGMLLGWLMGFLSLFLILLVLIQRGKGGGLSGALGGPGGQSAFGSKAGDTFTVITIVVATIWGFTCAFTMWLLGTHAPTTVTETSITAGPDDKKNTSELVIPPMGGSLNDLGAGADDASIGTFTPAENSTDDAQGDSSVELTPADNSDSTTANSEPSDGPASDGGGGESDGESSEP